MSKPTLKIVFCSVLASVGLWGCPSDSVTPCGTGADCASGVCNADGTCAPNQPDLTFPVEDTADVPAVDIATIDGSEVGGSDTSGEDGAEDSTTDDGSAPPDIPAGSCVFNNDGQIDRDELPLAAGQQATFRVAQDVTFNTGGVADGGSTTWDFSVALDGDQDVLVEALSPEAWWFADSFPGATYVARLTQSEDLLGIFKLTDDALQLLGVASPEDGFLKTELTYDPPVNVLQFPLTVGATWTTDSTVTGLTNGVGTFITETYEVEVDKAGEAVTPFSTFNVLRVATKMTRVVGITPYTERQLSFVSECFGVVAAARSEGYESQVDFGEVVELRRLAP